jgi:hypothetical protein
MDIEKLRDFYEVTNGLSLVWNITMALKKYNYY